jgi:hypothetical protein
MAAVNSRRNYYRVKSLYIEFIHIGSINADVDASRNNKQAIFIEKITNSFYNI